MESRRGSSIPKQDTGNSEYFCVSGPGAVPAQGAPCVPSTVPGFAGVPGKWCHRRVRAHPYTYSIRHTVQRGFQDGSIQREFQVGSPNRLVSYLGRLLGGGESAEMYSTQEAGDISGDCSSYGQGRAGSLHI